MLIQCSFNFLFEQSFILTRTVECWLMRWILAGGYFGCTEIAKLK
ncbi:hypothetical protein BAOM_2261 [Peribacillus asahii]|uniref:Uncharacterized protein n=1 Tax=Peribacillus asahii TaxID=228899 RepID=A0A3T0KR63_9BACI|nr:hypothetical protein BAOM_2261 [Peribacillus asahii]